jgi:hypothetical protein
VWAALLLNPEMMAWEEATVRSIATVYVTQDSQVQLRQLLLLAPGPLQPVNLHLRTEGRRRMKVAGATSSHKSHHQSHLSLPHPRKWVEVGAGDCKNAIYHHLRSGQMPVEEGSIHSNSRHRKEDPWIRSKT